MSSKKTKKSSSSDLHTSSEDDDYRQDNHTQDEETSSEESSQEDNSQSIFDLTSEYFAADKEVEKAEILRNILNEAKELPPAEKQKELADLINNIRAASESEEKLKLVEVLTGIVDKDTYVILYALPKENDLRIYFLNSKSIGKIFGMFRNAQDGKNLKNEGLAEYNTDLFDNGTGEVKIEAFVKINGSRNEMTTRAQGVFHSLIRLKDSIGTEDISSDTVFDNANRMLQAVYASTYAVTYSKDKLTRMITINKEAIDPFKEYLKDLRKLDRATKRLEEKEGRLKEEKERLEEKERSFTDKKDEESSSESSSESSENDTSPKTETLEELKLAIEKLKSNLEESNSAIEELKSILKEKEEDINPTIKNILYDSEIKIKNVQKIKAVKKDTKSKPFNTSKTAVNRPVVNIPKQDKSKSRHGGARTKEEPRKRYDSNDENKFSRYEKVKKPLGEYDGTLAQIMTNPTNRQEKILDIILKRGIFNKFFSRPPLEKFIDGREIRKIMDDTSLGDTRKILALLNAPPLIPKEKVKHVVAYVPYDSSGYTEVFHLIARDGPVELHIKREGLTSTKAIKPTKK